MTPDEMTTTLAEVLAEHGADISGNGTSWYAECTAEDWSEHGAGTFWTAADMHRAHLVAVLAATVTEAQAGALRESAWDIVRGAGLIPPPSGDHPAVRWLRARADSLVDRGQA